jgi:hypothetical protein
MTVPQRKKKVKQKKRVVREKRRILSEGKKRGKKQKVSKRRLVLNTNAKIKKLEKQVAALKRKVQARRKKVKAAPGTLLSPRSEAARKGWTTRRAKQAKILKELLDFQQLPQEVRDEIEDKAKTAVENKKQIIDEYIKRMPEYLIRTDREEFLVERKENIIMHRLIVAKWITGNFDEVAYQIAEEYDLEPNEVYGLWHGYELDE